MLARGDLIESDPDLVIRFLRGLVKGSEYAMQHRDETVDIVAAALKLDKAAADVTRKMTFPMRFDRRLYERYKQSSDFMVEMNFSKEPVDFDKCFWTDGLAAVDPARVEKQPV
jgi:ABC-type nitrate/sulfonate/bicarbonate transport system substrate-binding protein